MNNRYKVGDIVRLKESTEPHIITSISKINGIMHWKGVTMSNFGDGYTVGDFTDFDLTVVGHYDPAMLHYIMQKTGR
jgi:hypothetical protein